MGTNPPSIDFMALGSLATAVCALVATIWQAAISRKHNRLSVRPMLTLYRREIDGVITVKNNGSGPAIIQSYELYFGGKQVALDAMDGVLPTLSDLPDLTPGVAIAVGEAIDLVKSVTLLDGSNVKPLEDLKFRIVYRSIYGEERVLE
jgi:hypothetical protein